MEESDAWSLVAQMAAFVFSVHADLTIAAKLFPRTVKQFV